MKYNISGLALWFSFLTCPHLVFSQTVHTKPNQQETEQWILSKLNRYGPMGINTTNDKLEPKPMFLVKDTNFVIENGYLEYTEIMTCFSACHTNNPQNTFPTPYRTYIKTSIPLSAVINVDTEVIQSSIFNSKIILDLQVNCACIVNKSYVNYNEGSNLTDDGSSTDNNRRLVIDAYSEQNLVERMRKAFLYLKTFYTDKEKF